MVRRACHIPRYLPCGAATAPFTASATGSSCTWSRIFTTSSGPTTKRETLPASPPATASAPARLSRHAPPASRPASTLS